MHNFIMQSQQGVNAMTPAEKARQEIDRLLEAASWAGPGQWKPESWGHGRVSRG